MFLILLAIVFKLIKTVTQKDRDFDGNMWSMFCTCPSNKTVIWFIGGTEGKSRGELSCPNDVRSGKQQGRWATTLIPGKYPLHPHPLVDNQCTLWCLFSLIVSHQQK